MSEINYKDITEYNKNTNEDIPAQNNEYEDEYDDELHIIEENGEHEDNDIGTSNLIDNDEYDEELDVFEVENTLKFNKKKSKKVIIPNKNRITRPILTKYEKTLILGTRAQQISGGSPILIDKVFLNNNTNTPLNIARIELKNNVLPFIIRRPLPNGTYEDWQLTELKDYNQ